MAMEQRRERNRVSALLLLTDGIDGSARHRLPGLVARARAAGCALYGFGFGADHDAGLLSELAEQAETPFTYVEDTERVPEVFAGERRDVLVELVVPAAEGGATVLLEASARYLDLTRRGGAGAPAQSPAVAMEAVRVAEPQPEAEPDEEVSAQRERVEVTQALQQAAAHSDEGRFEAAQQVLEAADQRLESTGKKR